MRLTNNLRDAFVRAAMLDVPSEDFDEVIRKLVTQAAIDNLPKEVAIAYKKHPEYVVSRFLSYGGVGAYVPLCDDAIGNFIKPEQRQHLDVFVERRKQQADTINNLRTKLSAVAYSCKTLSNLKEALPEFEKYMVKENQPLSANLPAIRNVAKEFTEAGWPKEQVKKAA